MADNAAVNRLLRRVLVATGVLLVLFALIAQPDLELLRGFWQIQVSESGLITDSIVTGGLGGALLNAGLILLLSVWLVSRLGLPFSGLSLACLYMMAGFALLGKNLVNTVPILLGGLLYARYRRESFAKYVYVSFFGTCLSPMVSFLMVNTVPGLQWLTMGGCGLAIGFLLPAVSAYTVRIHQGYNLYNVGFAAGFVGLGIASILKGFGVEFASRSSWSQHNGPLLDILVWVILGGLLVLGIILGCRSFAAYRRIWRHSGRAVADFIVMDGPAPTFINMALVGAIGVLYLYLVGVTLNGPLLCCVLSLAGFGAFGKHPKNVVPVMAGAVVSSLVMHKVPLTDPGVLLATLLCTGLAPIAGQFGWVWGFAAGFVHMAIVQNTAFLHGGMNLYNNGFAAGLTCILMIPIIEMLKSEPKE